MSALWETNISYQLEACNQVVTIVVTLPSCVIDCIMFHTPEVTIYYLACIIGMQIIINLTKLST